MRRGRPDRDEEVCGAVLRSYHIAWWNLETSSTGENAVALGRRIDKVFRAIKNDIASWTRQLRDRKIEPLASLI